MNQPTTLESLICVHPLGVPAKSSLSVELAIAVDEPSRWVITPFPNVSRSGRV